MNTQPRTPMNIQPLEKNAPKNSNHWKLAAAALLLLAATPTAHALVLATETFNASLNGWTDRDPGELTSSHAAAFGNPAGSLHGSYALQAVLAFESDAFRAGPAASTGAFSGNYYSTYGNFNSFSFDFYSEDVLPSTFLMRLGDGANTFLYNMTPNLPALGTWGTVNVSLNYNAGWIGGNATQFSNLFNNLTFIDVQFARNGTGAQDYYLDNFSLNWNDPTTAVPEPDTFGLIVIGLGTLFAIRKHRRALAARDAKR